MIRKEVVGMILAAVALLVIIPSGMAAENVTVGFGTLKIGGIYQGHYSWYESDSMASEFDTKRARLLLNGTLIPDKVEYFIQAEAVQSPYLLDSKLMLKYISNTTISMGRFIPAYSLYMPKSTAQLNVVNYPLLTTRTAMWRQTGIQSTTTTRLVDLTLGVFNGYQTGQDSEALSGNDWGDNNDAKDFLLRADVKPMEGLKVGLYGWFGSAYNVAEDEDFDVSRYGINFEYTGGNLYLAGEYLMASTDSAIYSDSTDSSGFFAHVGYMFTENWEIHARYDAWDPNTDVDDNAENWITAGLNYKLCKYNTMFYLNYIARGEEGDEIDNDEIVVMFQYSF